MENWEMQTAINTFVDELTKYLFPDVPWLNEGNQREYEGIQAKCEELLPKYFRAKPLNCIWKEEGDGFERHFVVFYSPGTLFPEASECPIKKWDVDKAVELSYSVKERYGARPFGFRFITRGRDKNALDSKVIKESKMYYLGGIIKTLKEIKSEGNPDNDILISNMRCNGYDRIIENTNSYRWTAPLREGDVVLQYDKEKKP
jgi:hypothetical protein